MFLRGRARTLLVIAIIVILLLLGGFLVELEKPLLPFFLILLDFLHHLVVQLVLQFCLLPFSPLTVCLFGWCIHLLRHQGLHRSSIGCFDGLDVARYITRRLVVFYPFGLRWIDLRRALSLFGYRFTSILIFLLRLGDLLVLVGQDLVV